MVTFAVLLQATSYAKTLRVVSSPVHLRKGTAFPRAYEGVNAFMPLILPGRQNDR